jgi:nuclear transport factor 2 (NTF2) superfamily protein
VDSLSSELEGLAANHAEAWNTHNWDIISQVYTEDIVHHDGSTLLTGIGEVEHMATDMLFMAFPTMEQRLVDTFINREAVLSIQEYWNTFGSTEEDPDIEFELFDARDGRISYWTLFHDPEYFIRRGEVHQTDPELLADYTAVWSSGDPDDVATLYASHAVRDDTLFGDHHQGNNEIREFAANFFSWYPNLRLEQLQSFYEKSPGKVKGGVFAFHVSDLDGEPCAVKAAVLLEPSEEGIERERIYYSSESLIDCGWVR